MDTLREGLRTNGLKEPAARGCVALSEIQGLWSRVEVEEVVKGMDDIALNESDEEVRWVHPSKVTGTGKQLMIPANQF